MKHLRYLANVWLTIINNTVHMKQKKSSGKMSKQVKQNEYQIGEHAYHIFQIFETDLFQVLYYSRHTNTAKSTEPVTLHSSKKYTFRNLDLRKF